jgi:RHS repeat-associated protein
MVSIRRHIIPNPATIYPTGFQAIRHTRLLLHTRYDAVGNRKTLTDPVGNITTWDYDNLNRPTSETNQLGDVRSFVYDSAGRLVRQVDRLGRVRQFSFDNLSRNTGEIWYNSVEDADADLSRQKTFQFSYDDLGHMRSATDDVATYGYTYDALGRVTVIQQSLPGLVPMVTFSQQYDAAGRRTQLAAAIGSTADFVNEYAYDPLGRIDSVKQHGQSSGSAVASKYVDFLFDEASQPERTTRYADLAGNDLVARTDYDYDHAGRLTGMTHAQDQTTLAAHAWSYDRAGRIESYTNSVDGTVDYRYDPAGQLIGADYAGQTDEHYVYDSNGNRVTANGSACVTGPNNQLLSDGVYRYLYDSEGNRTARFVDADLSGSLTQGDTDVTEYTWDNRNRLTQVTHRPAYGLQPDQVVQNAYDFGNRWVGKSLDTDGNGTADSRTVFVYDGTQIALQFDDSTPASPAATADLTHRYLWGASVDQILADESVTSPTAPGEVLWPLTDHLGTVRDLAVYDAAQDLTTIAEHRVYTAFGERTSPANPAVPHLFGFTGRAFDEDTGLQNNLNRWYEPAVGRWMSEDPLGFRGDDTHLLRYVENSPLTRTDSKGLHSAIGVTIDTSGQVYMLSPISVAKGTFVIRGMLAPRAEGFADIRIEFTPKPELGIKAKSIRFIQIAKGTGHPKWKLDGAGNSTDGTAISDPYWQQNTLPNTWPSAGGTIAEYPSWGTCNQGKTAYMLDEPGQNKPYVFWGQFVTLAVCRDDAGDTPLGWIEWHLKDKLVGWRQKVEYTLRLLGSGDGLPTVGGADFYDIVGESLPEE